MSAENERNDGLVNSSEESCDESPSENTTSNENLSDASEGEYADTFEAPNYEQVDEAEQSDDIVAPETGIDYEELMNSDLEQLKEEFPELESLGSIAGLENPLRYAALRDMGLSAREAYLASSYRPKRKDNRSHLKSSAPAGAYGHTPGMSRSELMAARELFSGLSDTEIYSLYKRVSR